jgi:uncharacterized protein YutE (UPF0331/DUF86 family)
MERKLARLQIFLHDLEQYNSLEGAAKEREHYAIERLLQLLCEAAADIALQVLKSRGSPPPDSYRAIFEQLAKEGQMPPELATELSRACAMRNFLVHVYDDINVALVFASAELAVPLYGQFMQWAVGCIDA